MAIKIGSTDLKKCYIGSTELKSIYIGNTKLWTGEEEDPFTKYDVKIDMPASKEIDILYTSDIHVGWKNFGISRWGEDFKVFSLDVDQTTGSSLVGGDVVGFKNRLESAGYPTYLLDCGDWSKGGSESDSQREHAIDVMKNMGYLGISYGNWEFKWDPISTARTYMNKLKNNGFMACNFMDSSYNAQYTGNVEHEFPGCKTMKVGNKKIAFISVGYPSPNGFSTYGEYEGDTGVEYNSVTRRWNYKEGGSTVYRYPDSVNDASQNQAGTVDNSSISSSVYGIIQTYVTKLKNDYKFDYVIGFGHLDKYTEEDYSADSRFYSRADFIIRNITGLDMFIPGHLNQPVTSTATITQRDGTHTGVVAPTCGGNMNSFGRIRLDLSGSTITPTFKLLQSVSDLVV